jgi:excisionase family DNA binding protein
MERLLTVPQVVDRTQFSRALVYELIASGRLPSVTEGRTRRVREADLDEYIRGLRQPLLTAA